MGNTASAGADTAPNDTRQIAQFEPDRIIAETECQRLTSLDRVTRWRLEKRGEFPRRRQLSPGRVGWVLSEILAWQSNRAAA